MNRKMVLGAIFLFYKGEKTMTKREKALWLQEHYKNYSLKWYLENDARLNAMFRKAYHRYMTDLNARASKAQLSHIEDLANVCERYTKMSTVLILIAIVT